MEYNREHWEPRIATKPNRFRKLNESSDYVELINEPESITQAGTAFTADRLNNMEAGIEGAVAGVNEIQGVLDFTPLLGKLSNVLENKYINDVLNVSGDIYACVYNGDIYKQTGGSGSFVALNQTSRQWGRLATNGIDVYAIVNKGNIYKQTAKSGDFISVHSSSDLWSTIEAHEGDIYAASSNGYIYKQTGGVGEFLEIGTYSGSMTSLFSHKGNLYYITDKRALYKKDDTLDSFSFIRSTDIYLFARSTQAGLFCYYEGFFSVVGDDIRLHKKIKEIPSFSSFTSLNDKMYISTEGSTGDIYTATVLTGNTFRASSSFTLPAMPDGARKRILNTHATNAITVTAYSGTTIEGKATMTLSAGHEVELELIGTDWRKVVLSQSDTPEAGKAMVWPDSGLKADTATLATQALAIKPLGNSITLPAGSTSVTKIIKIATVNYFYAGLINIICDGVGVEDNISLRFGQRADISGVKVTYSKYLVGYGIKKIIVTRDGADGGANRSIYVEFANYPNYLQSITLGVVETETGTFTPSMTEVSSVDGTVVDSLSLDYLRGDISSYQHVFTKNIIGNLTGNADTASTADKIPFATKTGTSTGTQGQASFDDSYLYLCTATNVWKRVALTSF